jgi:hypothetical protein
MIQSKRLCNAFVPNTNPRSLISGFEIITCREINDYSGGTIIQQVRTAEEFHNTDEQSLDDPFYRVFCNYIKDYPKCRKAIGDFYNIDDASLFIEELTGSEVYIHIF